MKKYVVSLFVLLPLLAFQTPQAGAGSFAKGGFGPRSFAGSTGHRFASRSVIVINPARQVARFSPFAHRFVSSLATSSETRLFRVQSGSKPICMAFTVVDSLMETDS